VIRYAAFLRGVNLGKRTVKSADLKAAFVGMGFANAETLIASGNVIFAAEPEQGLSTRIERGLREAFGFDIGTVLRSHAELLAMIAAKPFAKVPGDADAKLYVSMLHEPIGSTLTLPYGVEGNFDVLSVTDTDIFAVAWKMPNGRYGEGLDALEKQFPKKTLITMRNWNTILKAAAKTAKDPS
jgi:uncharacterized protein (DUF1697 family)